MRTKLDLLIDDFHERTLPELMPRDCPFPRVEGKANAVIGMRRAGKTWFCYQQMQQLLEQGVSRQRLLYFNFEDDRLLPFSVADFQLIPEIYYLKFPALKDQQCFLFLDEVQRIGGWESFVRRLLDTERMTVCVTGSSSRLLSKEIATSLRGRSLTIEIFPFSFAEFLRFHDAAPPQSGQFGSAARARLQHMAHQYLKQGGFPEVQSLDEQMRRQILRNYLDVVLFRDVVERYSVQNTVALRSLMRHLLSAPSTRFSVNKFYRSLQSRGVACTKNHLYEYLNHLADAFLVYQVPLFSRSEKVRQVNPKKVYIIDPGLLQVASFRMTEDRGALLENLVYMQLRRRGLSAEYYLTQGGNEVDFVVLDDTQSKENRRLIQVCWDLHTPETRQREVQSLLCALDELNLEKGTIVTWLDEDSSHPQVEIVPAWKWLLDSK